MMNRLRKDLEKIAEATKQEEKENNWLEKIANINQPELESEFLKYGKGAENIYKAAIEHLQRTTPKTKTDHDIIAYKKCIASTLAQEEYITLLEGIKTKTQDEEGFIKTNAFSVYHSLNADTSLDKILPLPIDAANDLREIYIRLDAYFSEYVKNIKDLNMPGILILLENFCDKEKMPKKNIETIIKVKNKPIGEHLKYPIDPVNNAIWYPFFNGDKIPVGQKAYIDYDINFDELEKDENIRITKHLEPFDKKIYNIASNLYEAGNEYTTVTQIYKVMGKFGNLTTTQREEINSALTKMKGASIYIDNPNEIKFHKRRARARYDGSLLPFERVTVEINGAKVENAIHFFREPPLFTLAKRRGQIISIKKEVYDIPLKHTKINDVLLEYLIPVINAMKQLYIKPYLTFATIFKKCGITDKVKKVRTKERIRTILEHFKNTEYIKEYETTRLGIKFPEFEAKFDEQQKRIQKAKLERKAKQTKK